MPANPTDAAVAYAVMMQSNYAGAPPIPRPAPVVWVNAPQIPGKPDVWGAAR